MGNLSGADVRRLFLSAKEIKELTNWPSSMVEDYLNILSDLVDLTDEVSDNRTTADELENLIHSEHDANPRSFLRSHASDAVSSSELQVYSLPNRVNRMTLKQLTTDQINHSGAVANTNTPAGATAHALEIFDENGTLLGYIPIYSAQW